jgi:hypothetical protein
LLHGIAGGHPHTHEQRLRHIEQSLAVLKPG